MSSNEPLLDRATGMDEGIDGINQRLDEVGGLLESFLAQQGVTQADPARYRPTPFAFSVVPPDIDVARLALPSGRTVIDFEQGTVKNESEGPIYTETAGPDGSGPGVRTFADMSEGVEQSINQLRSLYILADVPIFVRLDDSPWQEIDSCNYYPLPSQGFTQVELQCALPFTTELKASTRADPLNVSGVAIHMDRDGQFPKDGGTTVQDDYGNMAFHPHALHSSDRIGDFSEAKPPVHTVSFSRCTWVVENDSGNGNAIDARLVAKDSHPGSGDYYQVAESTNIADGDHAIFDVSQRWHFMKVQVRNNTNGEEVSAFAQMAGGSP